MFLKLPIAKSHAKYRLKEVWERVMLILKKGKIFILQEHSATGKDARG